MMFNAPPLLLCVDLQNEFLVQGRPHSTLDAENTVACCCEAQATWRRQMWPIVHLKRTANVAYFDPASHLTDWINEVNPLPAEIAFEHPLPSAYSSARFREYVACIGDIRCVVVGFSLDDSIISTIIDGFHRGTRFSLVREAVGCRQGKGQSLKPPLLEVLASFCQVVDSIEVLPN